MSVNLGSAFGAIFIDTSKMTASLKAGETELQAFEKAWMGANAGVMEATALMGGLAAAGTALIAKLTMTAARTEELGVVVANMGRVHGKAQGEIEANEEAIKKLGITTQAARDMQIRLMGSELDLADATKIARAAQDLAVISMQDSSATAQELTYAIQSMQPRLLRKYGIYLNLVDVYDEAAKAQGVEADQLSESAKRLAWKNAVLEKAAGYTGTYEAAMTSAGKQLRSLPRYVEEASNAIGEYFVPMLSDAVGGVTSLLKGIIALPAPVKEGAAALLGMGTVFAGTASAIGGVVMMIPKLVAALTFLTAHPLVLAIAGVAALVAGLYALSKHLQKNREAQQEQAREILAASSTYDEYIYRLDAAGLKNKALSKEIWEVVKAKLANKDATEADKDAAIKLSEEQQKLLDVLVKHKQGYEEIAGVLPEYHYNVDAITDSEAKHTENLILQDKTLRDVAVAQGLLTQAQADAYAELEEYDRAMQAVAEGQRAQTTKAIEVDELLTEEVKANVQERVDALQSEAEAVQKAEERIAETVEDYELQRTRAVEDYADSRAETIRDFQLKEQEATEDHQRSVAEAEETHAETLLGIEDDYADKRADKATQLQETLAELATAYHKSVEDATQDHQAKILELETAYQKDRQEAIAEYEATLLELEADYQGKRAEKVAAYQADLTEMETAYRQDVVDEMADFQERIAELEAGYREDTLRDQEDFQIDLSEMAKDYSLDRERDQEDHLAKLAQMETNYADKVRDERKDLADDLKRMESDYQDWLADSASDYADSRADREQDYLDRLADHNLDYQNDVTDLTTKYQSDIAEAEAAGDAERVTELQAAMAERLALMDRDHQLWLERTQRDYEERAAVDEREREQALERAAREEAQKVALRKQQHAEEMAQLQADYEERARLEQEQYAQDMVRREQDFREKLVQQILAFVLAQARAKEDYDAKVADETTQHQQDLTRMDAAYQEKRGKAESQHEEDMARLDADYQDKVAKELAQHEQDLARMDNTYQEKVAKEDAQHKEKMADLDENYQEKVAKENEQHAQDMERLDVEHQARMAKEESQYKERTEKAEAQYQLERQKAREAHDLQLADMEAANEKARQRADEDHQLRMTDLEADLAEERQKYTDHIAEVKKAAVEGMMAAGEGAGAGMAAGLAKSRPLVEGAVSDMVDAMVAKAEADLGMGSPATRFIPHGVAITEAIGLGMLEGSDYLNDIMALIGDNLTGQAADIVNGILAMMGGIGAAGGGDGGMMPLPTGGISVAPDLQLSFEDTVKNQLRGIKNAADEALRLGDTFYANLLMERLAELQEFYGITSFAKGGVVPGPVGQPQLAMVHGGEIITPMTGGFLPPNIPAMFRGGGKGFIPPSSTPIDRRGGGRTVIEVPVYLDGREIARVTSPYLADELQQHGIRALG